MIVSLPHMKNKTQARNLQKQYKHAANDILERRLNTTDYSNWDDVAKLFNQR